ncbi:MAG: Type 1 glutamine amidotransferase-like domain-containing protein [Gordonia sp. (in: high G+C Gram-positive bacteria)]|uniref:Type 1 glutamine amidotransferase-like domain-containing protein n=1 Tax=Gordonia sp. (in: high G+C Gram-positive bacteria) TaxID=84139 RepID=UPI0039E60700
MRLLLTSFGHESIPDFVSGTIAYVPDAARRYGDAEFVQIERNELRGHGLELVDLPLASTPTAQVDEILAAVDGVYVAGGETFDLLHVLRSTGTDEILSRHVRAGLHYIGCSAGSIIAGPTIEPCSLLDDPAVAPDLVDYTGLGFTDVVVIPHAAGNLPPYPIDLYAETVRTYGGQHRLVLLRDGEALLVDDSDIRLV